MGDLLLERRRRREGDVGEVRAGADAPRRASGLNEDGPSLRGRDAGEGAGDGEEVTLVVDRAHLVRVCDDPGLAVPDEGVRLDAVPQRLADPNELLHPVVAPIVLHEHVEAVVRRIRPPRGGDHVEGDTAARDVVERIEQPRHVEGMHVGRRIGQAEADVARDLRERPDIGAHVLARPSHAPLDRVVARALPGGGNAGPVAEEDEVHEATLRDPGDVREDAHVGIGRVAPGARNAPAPFEMGPRYVVAEMDHALAHRSTLVLT